jgi:hypothetical protein
LGKKLSFSNKTNFTDHFGFLFKCLHGRTGGLFIKTYSSVVKQYDQNALAVYRSGHRIRQRNGRPGFESRQGAIFMGTT